VRSVPSITFINPNSTPTSISTPTSKLTCTHTHTHTCPGICGAGNACSIYVSQVDSSASVLPDMYTPDIGAASGAVVLYVSTTIYTNADADADADTQTHALATSLISKVLDILQSKVCNCKSNLCTFA